MRSLVLLTVLAAATGYGVIRTLPSSDAEPAAAPAKAHQVESIAFEGRALPVPALRAVLSTHTGDTLDIARLEKDRVAVEAELVARGYLAAKVAPAQVGFDAGGAFVTFAVTQGPLYHVHAIAVTGATARDAGVVTLVAGDPVEADRLAHARDALSARLGARGKSGAVAVELARDDREATVDVELSVR